jgi:hypothetical protein
MFITFTLFSCLYVAFLALPAMFRSESALWGSGNERTSAVFCFIICFSLSIALCILLVWHIYLSATAQTTVEFYYYTLEENAVKNVFDSGNYYINICSALGPPGYAGIYWLLSPFVKCKRPGNGIQFKEIGIV